MEVDGNGGEGVGSCCLSSFVDTGSPESHRYYLSRRTLLEMLKDRGYQVSTSEIDLTLQQFRAIHGQDPDIDRLRITASDELDPSIKILVVYCWPGVIKVSGIRNIINQITNKESLSGLILVLQNQITDQALKALDILPFKVETFQITDLLLNITKHVLKPVHQILTDDEKQELLKKHSIEEKQLPRMLQKDAIAKYYGLKRGQVVKVSYNGEITGSHTTYRCVW